MSLVTGYVDNVTETSLIMNSVEAVISCFVTSLSVVKATMNLAIFTSKKILRYDTCKKKFGENVCAILLLLQSLIIFYYLISLILMVSYFRDKNTVDYTIIIESYITQVRESITTFLKLYMNEINNNKLKHLVNLIDDISELTGPMEISGSILVKHMIKHTISSDKNIQSKIKLYLENQGGIFTRIANLIGTGHEDAETKKLAAQFEQTAGTYGSVNLNELQNLSTEYVIKLLSNDSNIFNNIETGLVSYNMLSENITEEWSALTMRVQSLPEKMLGQFKTLCENSSIKSIESICKSPYFIDLEKDIKDCTNKLESKMGHVTSVAQKEMVDNINFYINAPTDALTNILPEGLSNIITKPIHTIHFEPAVNRNSTSRVSINIPAMTGILLVLFILYHTVLIIAGYKKRTKKPDTITHQT